MSYGLFPGVEYAGHINVVECWRKCRQKSRCDVFTRYIHGMCVLFDASEFGNYELGNYEADENVLISGPRHCGLKGTFDITY